MASARAEEAVPVSALRPANTSSIVIRASVSSEKDIDLGSLSLGEIKTIARNIQWKLQKAIYGLPKGEERDIILRTFHEIASAQHRAMLEAMTFASDEHMPIDDETARERLPAVLQLQFAEHDPTKLDPESLNACLELIKERNPTRVAAK